MSNAPARKKILVVDDSEIVLEATQMALEIYGYEVIVSDTPIGVGALIRDEAPDLVLVDVTMPALSGDKFVELASRRRRHTCPIVLHSDRPAVELSRLAAECGANGYICKGSDPASLARAVARFLA